MLLPDDLMVGKPGALKQMVDAYAELGGNIICAEEVPADKTGSYGIITPGATKGAATEVQGLVEKPKPEEAPSRLGVVGRYILQPEVMAILGKGERGAGGEIQLTDGMAKLIGRQPFHALKVDAVRHDCGDKAGFVLANLAIALERDDLRPQIEEFLATARLSRARLTSSLCKREQPLLGLALASKRGANFAQLDRPGDDPGVERGIVGAQFLDRPGAGDPPGDARRQHLEMERLGDDVVGAGAKAVDRAAAVAAAGDQDDRRVLEHGVVADPPGQLDAADRRHAQLGQHQVDRQRAAFPRWRCRHCRRR